MFKVVLAQRLIGHNRHGIGQIKTARPLDHRDADAAVIDPFQQVFRQAARFPAEDEKHVLRIGDLRIAFRRFRAGIKERRIRIGREHLAKVFVDMHPDQRPVIQPRAFQIFILQAVSQRLDQMQFAPRRRARARNVAGILRDFRLNQYDMNHRFHPYFFLPPYCIAIRAKAQGAQNRA